MKGLKKILSIGCAVLTLASSMSFINVSADPPTVLKMALVHKMKLKIIGALMLMKKNQNIQKQLMISRLIGTAEI